MENGFSVLMLIFGAAILLYAAMLSGGNHKLLPLRVQPSLQRKDKKRADKANRKDFSNRCTVTGGRRIAWSVARQYRLPDRHGRNSGCLYRDCRSAHTGGR